MNTSPISSARPTASIREQAAAGVAPRTETAAPAPNASAQPAVAVQSLASASTPPIDTDRVALIRKAIASGNYPVVPAKIADAIIAAGMLLQAPK